MSEIPAIRPVFSEGQETILQAEEAFQSQELIKVKLDPSYFVKIQPNLLSLFWSQVKTFKEGKISHYMDCWRVITSDSEVLSTVKGMPIEFVNLPPSIVARVNMIGKF